MPATSNAPAKQKQNKKKKQKKTSLTGDASCLFAFKTGKKKWEKDKAKTQQNQRAQIKQQYRDARSLWQISRANLSALAIMS